MIPLKRAGYFMALILIITACAATLTPGQIVQKANTVNFADGVDQEEAVWIAQKYLIDNDLEATHSIYQIEEVSYDPDDFSWTVHFGGVLERGASPYRRFGFTPMIIVRVDGKTGKAEIAQ